MKTKITKENFEELSNTGRKIGILKYIKDCSCTCSDRLEGDNIFKTQEEYNSWSTGNGWGSDVQNRIDINSKDELKDSFDNVTNKTFCNKCFGLGKIFFPYVFKKTRYTHNTKANKESENIDNNSNFYIKNSSIAFFLPVELKGITLNDFICTLKHDSENKVLEPFIIENIYRIKNIEEEYNEDFIYLSVTGEKITFSNLKGVELIKYAERIDF